MRFFTTKCTKFTPTLRSGITKCSGRLSEPSLPTTLRLCRFTTSGVFGFAAIQSVSSVDNFLLLPRLTALFHNPILWHTSTAK